MEVRKEREPAAVYLFYHTHYSIPVLFFRQEELESICIE
jgi:hypothetical protein